MTELVIRPSSWDLELFLHVAGAMAVVAALVVAVAILGLGWNGDGDRRSLLTHAGFRTLLLAGIPSFLVMRIFAELILSKEGLDNLTLQWVDDGRMAADAGGLLLIIATILTGLAQRRMRTNAGGERMARIGTVLAGIVLVLFIFAIWAMTTKPT